MRSYFRVVVAMLACVFNAGVSVSARADVIRDTTLNFRLVIPDGFQPLPDVLKKHPELVYAFAKPDDAGGIGMLIFIEKMKGVVGTRSMSDPEAVRRNNGTIVEERWNGFRVEGTEILESINGVECVTRNTIVPLMPNAIILRVCSSRARSAEVVLVTKSLLGQLVGQTNWTRSRLSTGRERLYFKAAVLTVITLGVAEFVLFVFRRRFQRGALLALGVIFIVCGSLFEGTLTRHALILAGGLRLIGIIGLVLGAADLVIPRKTRRDVPVHLPTVRGPA